MTVTIPTELDEFVNEKLQTGAFDSATDVVAAALSAWQAQEVFRSMDQAVVESALLEAIDSPRIPWEEENLDQIIESLRKKHGEL
jgi:Arc/MetJ-type ribon-helix-helix transcriptional regulator